MAGGMSMDLSIMDLTQNLQSVLVGLGTFPNVAAKFWWLVNLSQKQSALYSSGLNVIYRPMKAIW